MTVRTILATLGAVAFASACSGPPTAPEAASDAKLAGPAPEAPQTPGVPRRPPIRSPWARRKRRTISIARR
jgi:hypothetical protein